LEKKIPYFSGGRRLQKVRGGRLPVDHLDRGIRKSSPKRRGEALTLFSSDKGEEKKRLLTYSGDSIKPFIEFGKRKRVSFLICYHEVVNYHPTFLKRGRKEKGFFS